MGEYIQLSPAEKEEIRRLTQKANRRINSFLKTYEQAGYKVIPKEVTAGFNVQSKQQFQTDNYAISRSVKFESRADFKKHINMLKKFEPGRADSVPTVREYNRVNRSKLLQAIETAGAKVDPQLKKQINKLDSAGISKFWKEYQTRALRKGLQYSSEAVMTETLEEFDPSEVLAVTKKAVKKARA